MDILSFSNGVLQLSSGVFTPYADSDLEEEEGGLAQTVARHHIPHPYTACSATPLLDVIMGAQFDLDVAEVLCALIGRALFKVNQLDGWQVMPFMVGVGWTGKSLILNIITSLFAPGAVGNLAAKREELFGMANLVDKEVVLGCDMLAKMSASLPQEIMQAMTAGEGMEVPRKGLTALQVTWAAPVILAGNQYPDYINTGNNIGRRVVTVRFDNVITTPLDDLQQRQLDSELPNIVCRCLHAYSALRARVKEVGGFWKAVPPIMLEWRSKLSASTNKLEEFFAMDDEERKCSITCVPGRVIWLSDFKTAFESKMGKGSFVSDPAVFQAHSFQLYAKKENVCLGCKQIASVGRQVLRAVYQRKQDHEICGVQHAPRSPHNTKTGTHKAAPIFIRCATRLSWIWRVPWWGLLKGGR